MCLGALLCLCAYAWLCVRRVCLCMCAGMWWGITCSPINPFVECLLTLVPFTVLLVYQLSTMKSPFSSMLASLADTHTRTRDGHKITEHCWRVCVRNEGGEKRVFLLHRCSLLLYLRLSTTHTLTHTNLPSHTVSQVLSHPPPPCATLCPPFICKASCLPPASILSFPLLPRQPSWLQEASRDHAPWVSFLPAAGRLMNQRFHGGSSGVSEGTSVGDRLHQTPSKQN